MAHLDVKKWHMNLNNVNNQQNIQINRSLTITKQATLKSQQKYKKIKQAVRIKENTKKIQEHNLFMLQCIMGAMDEF